MCLALLRFADWQRDRERECPATAFDARRFEADQQQLTLPLSLALALAQP